MAKLRKMLGSVEDPAVRELMGLIETQSRTTLTRWAAAYTAEQYLPLTGGEDGRLSGAVEAVSANLRGDLTLKEAKVLLAEARKAAQEETDPVRQAAARAVSRSVYRWTMKITAQAARNIPARGPKVLAAARRGSR